MKCDYRHCEKDATVKVGLILRSGGGHFIRKTEPLKVVCEDHKGITWRETVSYDGWADIVKGFKRRGLTAPHANKSSQYVEDI